YADHAGLVRVVVNVTIGILADVSHESPGWIVLPQLPPTVWKRVQRVRRDDCPFQFVLLARRQAFIRGDLLDYDASLPDFHCGSVRSRILPSIRHLTECVNVARQSADHMIP